MGSENTRASLARAQEFERTLPRKTLSKKKDASKLQEIAQRVRPKSAINGRKAGTPSPRLACARASSKSVGDQ